MLELPLPVRFAVLAGIALGLVGGVVGLVLGLISYPATAWFAVLEVGVPSALFGAFAGLVVGALALLAQRSPR